MASNTIQWTIIDNKCYNVTSCGDLDVGAGYCVVHHAIPGLHPLLALRILGLEVGGGALAGRRGHAGLGVRVLGVVIAVWSIQVIMMSSEGVFITFERVIFVIFE